MINETSLVALAPLFGDIFMKNLKIESEVKVFYDSKTGVRHENTNYWLVFRGISGVHLTVSFIPKLNPEHKTPALLDVESIEKFRPSSRTFTNSNDLDIVYTETRFGCGGNDDPYLRLN